MAEKTQARFNKEIIVVIDEKDFEFNVTPAAYIAYLNELQADDKYHPHFNLCAATVSSKQKDEVKELISHPAVAMSVGSKLINEYSKDVVVSVSKIHGSAGDDLNKKITISIDGKNFDFIFTPKSYITYINDLQNDDKYVPNFNLCSGVVVPEHLEEVLELLGHPATTMSVGSKLINAYSKGVEVSVKK